jgi:hypothetical protein
MAGFSSQPFNMNNQGPSKESWFKDGIDMGKDFKVSANTSGKDNVKEF